MVCTMTCLSSTILSVPPILVPQLTCLSTLFVRNLAGLPIVWKTGNQNPNVLPRLTDQNIGREIFADDMWSPAYRGLWIEREAGDRLAGKDAIGAPEFDGWGD